MARLGFLVGFKGQDPSEKPPDSTKENLKGLFTCKQSVAAFLGMETKFYKPNSETVTARAGYSKSVMKRPAGGGPAVYTTITVAAGSIVYAPDNSPRARQVTLKTGLLSLKGFRTIGLTFPSNMTVSQIGEALAEYIDPAKIQRTAANPSATEIFPSYTIKGGRTYTIPLKAAAEASISVDAPETDAEQIAVVTKAK